MDIKRRIKERGMSISSVAAKMSNNQGGIGVSQPTLSAIISGNPTYSKLQEIAKILGISVAELVADGPIQVNDSMVSFFHYRGVSKTPTEMEEVMLILKEWKREEFHALCQSHSFQYIRETFSQDTSIQTALDELCRLLPQVCEDK